MFVISIIIALGTGICLAVQAPTNSNLSERIGHFETTLSNFVIGSILCALLVVLFHFITGDGNILRVTQAAPWQLLGGVYGTLVVLIITVASPVLGVALMLTVMMLGQLVMGALVDALGLLRAPVVAIHPLRIVGILVVAAGIVLVYIGMGKQGEKSGRSSRTWIFAVIAFAAGFCLAAQAPTNASLSELTGTVEVGLVSFVVGLVLIFIVTMIVSRGKLHPLKGSGASPWMYLGGAYGAVVVILNAIAAPYLGVTLLMAGSMLGQLGGGMVIDTFGLLRMPKIRMNSWRCIGVVIIALGVVLVTVARML